MAELFALRPYKEAWEEVLPGILHCLTFQSDGLTVEDVLARFETGELALLTCPKGFVIIHERELPDDPKVKGLYFYMVYSNTLASPGHSHLIDHMADFEEMARICGYAFLQFQSPHKAYFRIFPKFGWQQCPADGKNTVGWRKML